MSPDPAVNFQLTPEQAIVLFEFLARFCEQDRLAIEHPAEECVLLAISARLDKALVSPFLPDYLSLLSRAREAVVSAPVA